MIFLNSVPKIPYLRSLVAPHWVVLLQTRLPVNRQDTEFANISSFTSLLMCSTHYTVSSMFFFFPSPPANILSSLCLLKSPDSLPGWYCVGPFDVGFLSGNNSWSELDVVRFWPPDIQDPATSCRKFFYFICVFVFSVLYTKNAIKSVEFSR